MSTIHLIIYFCKQMTIPIKEKKKKALEDHGELLSKAIFDPEDFEKNEFVKKLLNFPAKVSSYYQEQRKLWKKLFLYLKYHVLNFIQVIENQESLTNVEKNKLIQGLLLHLGYVFLGAAYPISVGLGTSFFYIYYHHAKKIIQLINKMHKKTMRFFYHERSISNDKKRAEQFAKEREEHYAQAKAISEQTEITLNQLEKLLDLVSIIITSEKMVDDLAQLPDSIYAPLNEFFQEVQDDIFEHVKKEMPKLWQSCFKFKSFEEERFDSLANFKEWQEKIEKNQKKSIKLKLKTESGSVELQDVLANIFDEKKSAAFEGSQIKSNYFCQEETLDKIFPLGALQLKEPILFANSIDRVVSIIEEEQKEIHKDINISEIEDQSERLKKIFFQDNNESSDELLFNNKLLKENLVNSIKRSFMVPKVNARTLIFSQNQHNYLAQEIGLRV